MTKLIEHISRLQLRLAEVARDELALIRALDDALSRVDEKLLNDVRTITSAHEARRGTILCELEALAVRVGAFPRSTGDVPALGADQPSADPAELIAEAPQHAGGDWRQATRNIEADLDFVLERERNGHAMHRDEPRLNGFRAAYS